MENGLVKKVIDVLLPCIFPKSNTFRYISNVEMSTSAVKKELVGWVFLGDDILPNHMGIISNTIIPDPYENQRTRASHVMKKLQALRKFEEYTIAIEAMGSSLLRPKGAFWR